MYSIVLKGKEIFFRHRTFFIIWLLASIKIYYETGGFIAGFFNAKLYVCLFFYFAFSLLVYCFCECLKDDKSVSLIFCSFILFAYYCCMNKSYVSFLRTEDYAAAAILLLSIVFALTKQTAVFSLPLSFLALFVSPETTAVLIPVVLCLTYLDISNKSEDADALNQKRSKFRKKNNTESRLKTVLKKTASIHPAVIGIPHAVFYVLSFFIYSKRNPYEPIFSIESMGAILKNGINIWFHFSPFVFFALAVWICILRVQHNSKKDFFCLLITSLLICAVEYIIPKSALATETYLSTVLVCSLSVTAYRISRDTKSRDAVVGFVLKYRLAIAVIAISTAGIFLKYYQ